MASGFNAHLILIVALVIGNIAPVFAESPEPLSGTNFEDFNSHTQEGVKWQNNPFVHPLGDYKIEELMLMAIVYHPEDRAVIINGEFLREGDKLGENELVRIEKKYVVLKNLTGIFRLNLEKTIREAGN